MNLCFWKMKFISVFYKLNPIYFDIFEITSTHKTTNSGLKRTTVPRGRGTRTEADQACPTSPTCTCPQCGPFRIRDWPWDNLPVILRKKSKVLQNILISYTRVNKRLHCNIKVTDMSHPVTPKYQCDNPLQMKMIFWSYYYQYWKSQRSI